MTQPQNALLLPTLLLASLATYFALPALAQNTQALEADEITVDDASGTLTAKGEVRIEGADGVLTTQWLTLSQETPETPARFRVPGPLTLIQSDGAKISASSAELNRTLDTGTLTDLRMSLAKGARLGAAEASKNGATFDLRDGVFTSCPACEKNPDASPLWQVRAGRIHYDQAAQDVIYTNSRLEIYGLPVVYLPYLAHAGPEVARRSGFLTPAFTSSNTFGRGVEIPYFFDLAPNYDLTVTPRLSAKQDPFIKADWRHLTQKGSYQLTTYWHEPKDQLAEDTSHSPRGGLVGTGDFHVADWDIDFAVQEASDDLFFKRYKINDTSRLENRLTATRLSDNQDLTLETRSFRNTVSPETAASVDQILPSLTHQIYFDAAVFGGQLDMTNRLSHETRELGIDVSHLQSQLDWSWRHIHQAGFVWEANNRLVVDAYHYSKPETDAQTEEIENAEDYLAANATALTLSYPLQSTQAGHRQTLTPKAQVVLASENDDYATIPYIAAASLDLTSAQLFQPIAPTQEASRVNLGLSHTLEMTDGLRSSFFIGQSYNLSDLSFSEKSGYGDDYSALLADWAVYMGPLTLKQNTRLGKDSHEILRSESSGELAFTKFTLGLEHSFYEAEQLGPDRDILEEAAANVDWQMSQNWSLSASQRENLETGARVKTNAALLYEDECTIFQIKMERDYSRVSGTSIKPETSVDITFTLKTIRN
jgi:LPS-assembly protein